MPDWPNEEYDRIYVFQIDNIDGKKDQTFKVEHQGLTGLLSDECPSR